MDQTDKDVAGLIRRAEHIASLVKEISDDRWVTELITMLSQPGWSTSADRVMVELTLADVERSAQKLLDLRDNLMQEIGSIGRTNERPQTRVTRERRAR